MTVVLIPARWGVLDTTLCKTDCHNITEILLKVALNTITLTPNPSLWLLKQFCHIYIWQLVQLGSTDSPQQVTLSQPSAAKKTRKWGCHTHPLVVLLFCPFLIKWQRTPIETQCLCSPKVSILWFLDWWWRWNKMYIFILKQRYYVTEIISFTKIMWPLIRAILFKHTFHSSKAL